jgi:CheY-like chemotaxis protein
MPGTDGLRCLDLLRERHPEVKCIVLSGSEEPDVVEAAFRRVGVLRVNSIADIFYMTEVLANQPRPKGPKLAIVTGMTRDGVFLVERGEIVGPVRNLRFTQSYLAALAGVEAVGRDRRRVSGDFSAVVVPAVRISAFNFTGATEH